MFRPLKNFITYLQRNASSSSLFGGSTSSLASQETVGGEMDSIKVSSSSSSSSSSSPQVDDVNRTVPNTVLIKAISTPHKDRDEEEVKATKTSDIPCSDVLSAANTNQDFDEDDIETQIKSSIMLKKPLREKANNNIATNGTVNEIDVLNITKSSGLSKISRDYNSNHASETISLDDELEDFRHDPTEGIEHQVTMSHFRDLAESDHNAVTEKIANDLDLVDVTNNNSSIVFSNLTEVPEEPYLDIEHFPNNEIIVVGEDELNSSMISESSINDDPLAIANDEGEAFTIDRSAALKELNLLNTCAASIADDDVNTVTTEDDLECWLGNEAKHQFISVNTEKGRDVLLTTTESTTEKVSSNDERGEGSDSGLGSETTVLQINVSNMSDTSKLISSSTTPSQIPIMTEKSKSAAKIESDLKNVLSMSAVTREPIKPKRSNLKRRLEAIDDDDDDVGLHDLTGSIHLTESHSSVQKKPKRSINFNTVQVFYFPRQQGFSCVPSAGGCTLGMASHHVAFKTMTLAEHAAELRRAHRMQLQEINPRGSSSDDSEESEEDYLSEGSGSDLDAESSGFLQPVSPKQRRALLKAAGIRKIDASEKADCRDIRNSREVCGCTCRDFCDPETCSCSQSGIKCQVDRDMFPCGCSRDACGNTVGRVEFNPARVRTHFIHTLMRLEMENRQPQNPYHVNLSTTTTASSTTNSSPVNFYQSHMQSQSNYSSGYASPAYNALDQNQQPIAANDYYQQQQQRNNTAHLYDPHIATMDIITHSVGNALPTSTAPLSQYAVDSLLDSNLFAGATSITPGYGDLMPVSTYHNINYGNVATQVSTYNSYPDAAPFISMNGTNLLDSQSATFNSCSMPSDRPYGTATTTESSVVEFTRTSQMTTLETTTAPSYPPLSNDTFVCSMETETTTNFISLSTPLASSTHLTQINDLLQCNRNVSSALVAVSQKRTLNEVTNCKEEQMNDEINITGHDCENYSKDVLENGVDDKNSLDVCKSKGIYEELSTLTAEVKAEGINDEINSEKISTPPSVPSILPLPEENKELLSVNRTLCEEISLQSYAYVNNDKSLPQQTSIKCESETIGGTIINIVSN